MRRKGLKAATPRKAIRSNRRLSAAAWPLGPAPAFGRRRRLPAKRSLDRDGRGRRRRPWQSAGRPVWRPGGGGSLFGGGASAAGLGGSGLTGSNPTEITEINNYYDDKSGRGSDADFQQFDPGAPGVQDANFDNLDDSAFDNSGSSSDDGGGYDDV